MTQSHRLEIFRSVLLLGQQKGLAQRSVGDALLFLGNNLILSCLDSPMAVKFLPITPPENRVSTRVFWAARMSPAKLPLAWR